ncbi:serine/threonine protein kinase [Streptomyces nogalater]
MTSCVRPGCAGRIMATGYCDTCGHRHAEPRTEPHPGPRTGPHPGPRAEPRLGSLAGPRGRSPGATAAEEPPGPAAVHAVAGLGELDQHGLVVLPEVPAPDDVLLTDPRPPTGGRRCGAGGCTMTIGVGYGGQPARATGRCPRCGTPYSLLPQLAPATSSPTTTRCSAASPTAASAGSTSPRTPAPTATASSSRARSTSTTSSPATAPSRNAAP